MTLVLGRRIWSFWALTLVVMAAGMAFAGALVWGFPGPPVGPLLVFVGVPIALLVASRLWVGFGADGVIVPAVRGRNRIAASSVVSLAVVESRAPTVPPVPRLVPRLQMVDGSVRDLRVLTAYMFGPAARPAFDRAMQALAQALGKPVVG
ncbi:hypothetical protein [Intrasporangium oryzae]|uniref:hypothetical protein n=1 Tax=Intrasporangium oryzae TaxID=412687 RepID=UPI0012F9F697|nr:hypothetical protein [Intrasporangium oryzae]